MRPSSERVAFTRVYATAPIGRSVAQMLQDTFGESAVEIFDITKLLKQRPWLMASNAAVMAGIYGPALMVGKKKLRSAFIATPYLHRQVKKLIQETLTGPYRFTFQLQSLFDASIPGVPHFIYTDHTHLANLEYDNFHPRALHTSKWISLEKKTYGRATHIFTRSTNISRSLIKQYDVPEEKVTCVYAGANGQIVPVDLAADPADRFEKKNILFVGIDWERKGGPELVKAFAGLLVRHPDAHLTVVGAAPEIDLPRVTVVGRVPVDEVHRYFRQASIFCLPTKLEPFGIVFIEAMSHRLPIVSTRVGALPDMVQDGQNGFLVEPGEVAPLMDALDLLLQDANTRKAYGEAGYQLALSRYNWDTVGQRIREIVEEKIEESKPRQLESVG